jgi:hypothetical protein
MKRQSLLCCFFPVPLKTVTLFYFLLKVLVDEEVTRTCLMARYGGTFGYDLGRWTEVEQLQNVTSAFLYVPSRPSLLSSLPSSFL